MDRRFELIELFLAQEGKQDPTHFAFRAGRMRLGGAGAGIEIEDFLFATVEVV